MKKRSNVVVDTGVLISAFAFGGVPKDAVSAVFRDDIVCVSQKILSEYREIPLLLEKQGKIDHTQLKSLIEGISIFVSDSIMIKPSKRLDLCRDPKDNMLLECCLEARADYLITGDKDLLVLVDLPFRLSIMKPADYLRKN